ncbi:MAG: class I SAM-dependent methyltransferase [Nitrososphaerota archaeon]|nr:class I SAM-dependent methyltransferase [Nitrososphaerota archaeon]
MSDGSRAVRSLMLKVNGAVRMVMRRLGFEFYLVPIPKATVLRGQAGQSPLLYGEVNWLRIPMYLGIEKRLQGFESSSFEEKKAVELGGSEGTILGMLRERGARTEVAPDYPTVDIENLPYGDGEYDFVVLDQVLEHVRHPWAAVGQVKRVLKQGGICICTSVLVYPIHKGFVGSFGDYYRFSPDGFRALFEGFEIIESDGWGSSEVMKLVYNHSERGPEGSAPISKVDANRGGLYGRTDGMNLLMTWCIARKS